MQSPRLSRPIFWRNSAGMAPPIADPAAKVQAGLFGRLTDAQRQKIFAAFGPDPDMQL
jgi:hypothetical protein